MRGFQAAASTKRSGYHHSWFDTRGINLKNLAKFPSNLEVQNIIKAAHFEAESLLKMLDIYTLTTPGSTIMNERDLREGLETFRQCYPDDDEDDEDNHKASSEEYSSAQHLENLLAADAEEADEIGLKSLDKAMMGLGIAATATTIHDHLRM